MKKEFQSSGLDFNSKQDRLEWIKSTPYHKEWLDYPHYWVEVNQEFYDPSGHAQFVDSGLSSDINDYRYKKESYSLPPPYPLILYNDI